ncbi:PspA-associated protein PspAB [Nocardioides sp. CPCC 205120]|uniref:PspA-associated protein PspAB n=1 Tax=Nocardioides sp. CPCC 205120 TaxID=3406462 RepID=UPI003B50FBBB
MGFWDAVLGRRAPKQADLDALFGVPSAAITLQTAMGLEPTGVGSVCFRSADGAAFRSTEADIVALLDADPRAPAAERTVDQFGFTWLVVRREPTDVAGLCTDLHAVNVLLEEQGFGPSLLCSVVGFAATGGGSRLGLVYLYKQGTFYPFAPTGADARDNLLEINVRDQLATELPVEQSLQRWLALWGAPGL